MSRLLLGLCFLLSLTPSAWGQGVCTYGAARATLDVNNVAACVGMQGSLFRCGSGVEGYEVPKGSGAGSVFQSGIWLGGLVDGAVRFAGSTYGPYDFWPGPLSETGDAPSDCDPFDRIYKVSRADVEAYDGGATPAPDLADWPASLGAPVVDGDGVPGNYDLAAGDRPDLQGGDQTLWWVLNDQGNLPAYSDAPTPGVEIRIQAWAHDAPSESHLHNTTFYRFTVLYRGDEPLTDTRLGLWMDADIGGSGDDFIASDPSRNLAYAYNGGPVDSEYGDRPAALGVTVLKGLSGTDGQDTGASSVVYYDNVSSFPTGRPQSGAVAADSYDYMRAEWLDESPFTEGGTGYGGTTPTSFVFSGVPGPTGWSEPAVGNMPGDRLFVVTTGPGTLAPDSVHEVDLALVWARAPEAGSQSHLNVVTDLLAEVDQVQAFVSVPTETGPTPSRPLSLAPASRNPTPGPAAFALTLRETGHVVVDVLDVLGRRVRVVEEGTLASGAHTVDVETSGLTPGVYVVRARSATASASRSFTVVR